MKKSKIIVRPTSANLWHPDEGIGLSTIESAVKSWTKEHLHIEDCDIEIQDAEPFEESLKSFKDNEELFEGDSTIKVKFSDELID